MAYISFQPSDYFNTVLYTGDNTSSKSITGVGFQPDFLWIKCRNAGANNILQNSNVGANKSMYSDQSDAESTDSSFGHVNSFDSDGFTVDVGNTGENNANDSLNYVSWSWLANGGTTSSNTDGSITSTVQANTTAGFSIVTYTGTGSASTVGHGLGVAPELVIVKERGNTNSWLVQSSYISSVNFVTFLNRSDTGGENDSTTFNGTHPTSSVFSVGTHTGTNRSSGTYVAYCFASKKGYSKIGAYTGNGSADGPFIYTGFKPSWLMIKCVSTGSTSWNIFDTTREDDGSGSDGNVMTEFVQADSTSAEGTSGSNINDFLSNGFKLRGTSSATNASSGSYIYMAFAEHPLVASNGLPATAR